MLDILSFMPETSAGKETLSSLRRGEWQKVAQPEETLLSPYFRLFRWLRWLKTKKTVDRQRRLTGCPAEAIGQSMFYWFDKTEPIDLLFKESPLFTQTETLPGPGISVSVLDFRWLACHAKHAKVGRSAREYHLKYR